MLFDYYKNGFTIDSPSGLNRFIRNCVDLIENYLSFLSYKGNLFIPMDLSLYDAAIDITAELFTVENGTLIKFKSFFDKIDEKPVDAAEFEIILKSFLFSVAKRNLISIYKDSDPVTAKIIRNLNLEIERCDCFVTEMFTDRYLHKSETDFSQKDYCERDELIKIISAANDKINLKNTGTYLRSVLEIFDSQDKYVKAVSFTDLVFLYKYFITTNHNFTYNGTDSNGPDAEIHYKFLMEEIKHGFYIKLKKYFLKKNYSEKEQKCLYNAIEEYLNSIVNGGVKRGASDLTREFFPDGDFVKNRNRVEYCLEMLQNELTPVLLKGEI